MTPNTIFFSELLKVRFPKLADELELKLKKEGITPQWLPDTLDIWIRDFMPIQIDDNTFVHYAYYPDYLLKYKTYRGKITNPVKLEQKILLQQGKTLINLPLILDGGNVVMSDSNIFMTNKVLVENSLSSDEEKNEELIRNELFKIFNRIPIFIKWDKRAEEFGHTDWLVRYLGGKDKILVIGRNEKRTATMVVNLMAQILFGKFGEYELQEFKLDNPNEKTSWAYLNFVQINDIILMPIVNDEINDKLAEQKLYEYFKLAGKRVKVIPIDCSDLIKEGGALHCISWNIKL